MQIEAADGTVPLRHEDLSCHTHRHVIDYVCLAMPVVPALFLLTS